MSNGWFVESTEPIPVPVACLCPGTPHPDGDTIYLRPELDASGGLGVTASVTRGDLDVDSIQENLGRAYLLAGIESWTFVDADGKPVPCTRQNIRKLRWNEATYAVADKASDLYGNTLDPLVAVASRLTQITKSSPNGRTGRSTSRSLSSSASRRKR